MAEKREYKKQPQYMVCAVLIHKRQLMDADGKQAKRKLLMTEPEPLTIDCCGRIGPANTFV